MAQKTNGLSRDFIIHPGETLQDILDDRNITLEELSISTGFTTEYIDNILNGKGSFTNEFSTSLENHLNVNSSFWVNLQNNYDKDSEQFENAKNVLDSEFLVLKRLKDVVSHFIKIKLMNDNITNESKVLALRKIFNISNLADIPSAYVVNGAFRASNKFHVDSYVLFAWLRLCEIQTEKIKITNELDITRLKKSIQQIKEIMFLDANTIRDKLTSIFANCGIAFSIVKNFRGAPVQGFIKRNTNGKTLLCMTIRQGSADIFWFTLFHEIAHIINGDANKQLIDFSFTKSYEEDLANNMAKNYLISDKSYDDFISKRSFTLSSINHFSMANGIPNYILIGRLQRDKYLSYDQFSKEKRIFKWAD